MSYTDLFSSITVIIALFMVFIFSILGFVIYIFYFVKKQLIDTLKKQALKRNGTITSDSQISEFVSGKYPKLSFKYHNFSINVMAFSPHYYGGPAITLIECLSGSKEDYEFIVYRKSLLTYRYRKSEILKSTRLQTIQLNIPTFDGFYKIKGSDEDFIRSIFTSKIHNKLWEFKSYRPLIKFNKDVLTIEIPRQLIKDQDYDELIDIALMFCDRLKELKNSNWD